MLLGVNTRTRIFAVLKTALRRSEHFPRLAVNYRNPAFTVRIRVFLTDPVIQLARNVQPHHVPHHGGGDGALFIFFRAFAL